MTCRIGLVVCLIAAASSAALAQTAPSPWTSEYVGNAPAPSPVLRRLPSVDGVEPVAFVEEIPPGPSSYFAPPQEELIAPDRNGVWEAPPYIDNVGQVLSRQPAPINGMNGQNRNGQVGGGRTSAPIGLEHADDTQTGPGVNLISPPTDFDNALPIPNTNAWFKIGGYVKVDLIHDFNAIESTDSFDTVTIPTSGPQWTNTRFHARQTRLNLDVRWDTPADMVRLFVEGDFFSDGDRFRLRHAYGEVGPWTAGQTWTTFTDSEVLPQTLDFEGSVASISLRRGLVRWTTPLWLDGLTFAASVEDPREILELPPGVTGRPITQSPDFVARLRHETDYSVALIAFAGRELGFLPTGGEVITARAWGVNSGAYVDFTRNDRLSFQLLFGQGIGSFRGLPDVAPVSMTMADTLNNFALTGGYTHQWTPQHSSNVTYASSVIPNLPGQAAEDLHSTQYLAINFIANPLDRVFWGVEYLWGQRVDLDRDTGKANRLQASVFYYLP